MANGEGRGPEQPVRGPCGGKAWCIPGTGEAREAAVEEEEEQLREMGKSGTRSRTTFMSSASTQATQGGSGKFCANKDRISLAVFRANCRGVRAEGGHQQRGYATSASPSTDAENHRGSEYNCSRNCF